MLLFTIRIHGVQPFMVCKHHKLRAEPADEGKCAANLVRPYHTRPEQPIHVPKALTANKINETRSHKTDATRITYQYTVYNVQAFETRKNRCLIQVKKDA